MYERSADLLPFAQLSWIPERAKLTLRTDLQQGSLLANVLINAPGSSVECYHISFSCKHATSDATAKLCRRPRRHVAGECR